MSIPNEIMIPRDWYTFVDSVRGKGSMKISEMGQNNFLSYSHLLTDKLVKRTKDTDGNNEFKKGYQPRAYVIKKHGATIVAYTTSILSGWELFFSNLLNVNQSTSHEGSEVYTAEPDIPDPIL